MKRYRCYFAGDSEFVEDQCFLYCRSDQAAWSHAYEALSRRPGFDYAVIWNGLNCVGFVWNPERKLSPPRGKNSNRREDPHRAVH